MKIFHLWRTHIYGMSNYILEWSLYPNNNMRPYHQWHSTDYRVSEYMMMSSASISIIIIIIIGISRAVWFVLEWPAPKSPHRSVWPGEWTTMRKKCRLYRGLHHSLETKPASKCLEYIDKVHFYNRDLLKTHLEHFQTLLIKHKIQPLDVFFFLFSK